MTITFFGSPEIARIFLEHIFKREQINAVITSPDKPAGRGLSLRASPVKEFAIKNNLEVLTPTNLKEPDFISRLSGLNPQLGIVVSYGKIIPLAVINMFKKGCVNIHFSLLPKYRGAAPIQWALMRGEKITGVTTFFIDEGMDTGKIILQKTCEITDSDDYHSLEEKLIDLGIDAMDETLELIASDKVVLKEQFGKPSYAPLLKKSDGKINWNKSADEINNLIRAICQWPTAFSYLPDGEVLKILKSEVCNYLTGDKFENGTILKIEKHQGLIVQCGSGFLKILKVKPQNKSEMSAWDFLQGHKLKVGDILR